MTPTASRGYEEYRKAVVKKTVESMMNDINGKIKSIGFRYDENSMFPEVLTIKKNESLCCINIAGLNRKQISKELHNMIHKIKSANTLHPRDYKILDREIANKEKMEGYNAGN